MRHLSWIACLLLGSGVASAAVPPVPVPPENPVTEEKRVLGKILFWEEQLSSDRTMACGTCHGPAFAFTDLRFGIHPGADGVLHTDDDALGSPGVVRRDASGAPVSDSTFGFEAQVTPRTAPNLLGAAYAPSVFWDGRAAGPFLDPVSGATLLPEGGALEIQSLVPILSAVEMAREDRTWADVVGTLARARPLALAFDVPPDMASAVAASPSYPELFARAFGDPAITPARIAFALATYERTLIPDRTPWDAFVAGDSTALTPVQREGWAFFESSLCAECHTPPLFTDHSFRNIGLRPPEEDPGRAAVTGLAPDRGKFKVPTLRNVGDRPRLMHHGRIIDVVDAIDFYRLANGVEHFVDAQDPLVVGGIPVPPETVLPLLDFLVTGLRDLRVRLEEWPFDRPTLRSETNVPLPVPSPIVAGTGVPNPFRVRTRFTVPGAARILSGDVFAANGRRVRRLSVGAGGVFVEWNGRDDTGRTVPPGVYFYRLRTDTGEVTGQSVRIR